jgi:hypothetical protein
MRLGHVVEGEGTNMKRLKVGQRLYYMKLELMPDDVCDGGDPGQRHIDLSPTEVCAWMLASRALGRVNLDQLDENKASIFERTLRNPSITPRAKN